MEKTYNGKIEANVSDPICIVSNQGISFGSSGHLELRKDSKTGDLIESFDVNSDRVKISARELLIYPTNSLPYETEVYLVMSNGFIVSSINGSSFSGFDINGSLTYKFTTEKYHAPISIEFDIGDSLSGGTIISKENGIYTIISPKSMEMNLTWYEINKAILEVEERTKSGGWYIPSLYELQNYISQLGTEEFYWTGTEIDSENSYVLNINENVPYIMNKNKNHLIRLFKKVNY